MSDFIGVEPSSASMSEYNAMDFIVRQIAGGMMTSTDVIVKAVGADANGYPTVDVQPMVSQIDGAGNTTPHGTIHSLPVFRLQGGDCAIIVTPAVGDKGTAVFAREDTSAVRATGKPGPPGSRRRYSYSDGMYFGGILNAAPTTIINIMPGGMIHITAPTSVTVTSPIVNFSGNVMVTGDLITGPGSKFNGKPFDSHVHSGISTGTSNSGPPV